MDYTSKLRIPHGYVEPNLKMRFCFLSFRIVSGSGLNNNDRGQIRYPLMKDQAAVFATTVDRYFRERSTRAAGNEKVNTVAPALTVTNWRLSIA